MATTQQELAVQMLAQFRRLDPSVSAEVGTPERKIFDTVAQALADAQVDLNALQVGLDLDSKFGDSLDRFLALFGFGRQKATYSTGFVTFSRPTASTVDITIPANTQLQTPRTEDSAFNDAGGGIIFYTTTTVVLQAGTTSVVAPIRAAVAGAGGNVAANLIVNMIGTFVLGVTTVTNETATRGGIDAETDNEFKVRFRNTVFRNLAGTRDQYLALAVATQFSLKANVIGSQSLWREYVQVPPVDDATDYDVNDDNVAEAGGGLVAEYTTALSVLPYAKGIWSQFPAHVSNGQSGPGSYFYRPEVDFRLNTDNIRLNRGDARRIYTAYGALGAVPDPATVKNRPNVTFMNVYTGTNPDVQVPRPNETLLVEFSYLSDASRNDLGRNITNAVDVYVDGGNNVPMTTVLTAPTNSTVFVDNPTSKYHYENFRRAGEPAKRPHLGNFLMPLYWQPVTALPPEIIISNNTYTLGTHYWLVEEISEVGGSARARSGIEWSQTVKGNVDAGAARLITEWIGVNFQPIEVEGYFYDKNISDLQIALEGSKQITTDVLAHKATPRFFKFDITVSYSRGANTTETNQAIRDAVDTYLKSQYFGVIVQLSDIIDVIHTVPGVDNVRWSSDLPANEDLARVYECDKNGKHLLNMTADHFVIGDASTIAIQKLFLTGQPLPYVWSFNATSGAATQLDSYLVISSGLNSGSGTVLLSSSNLASSLETHIRSISGMAAVTVTEEGRSTTGVKTPIRSFTVTWPTAGAQTLLTPVPRLKGGPTVIYNDFVLRDNELPALPTGLQGSSFYGGNNNLLPADTVPGLIIRNRAQNTFIRS